MKKVFTILIAIVIVSVFAALKVKEPHRIIFFGDSITEQGAKPGGYISILQEHLKQQGKSAQYELIGAGIGGNKVYDLYLRLDKDVLQKNPGTVVIYIGVNDVWHKRTSGTGTDFNKFEAFYSTLIEKIKAGGAKVVLCTPAVIGEKTDHSNEQDGDLNKYSALIRTLAKKYDAPLVDLRKLFLAYNLKNNPENKESGILTTDRVHLNEAGNKFVADNLSAVIF